jgi:hypothetical protein
MTHCLTNWIEVVPMASRFLFNDTFWTELKDRIPKAKAVRAAVAYLGTGGSHLLPLRKGDKLVVDMSLKSVRAGTTDPREVRRLLRRGVQVFSRGSLHAKFFIIDRTVIAGSANVSGHARHSLDEAAVLTDDGATVRRAMTTFDLLCTEPVRKDYLEKCIAEYRPPRFMGAPLRSGARRKKPTQGKVWVIGGLIYKRFPDDEAAEADRVLLEVSKKLRAFESSEVDDTRYASKQSFFSKLRAGDWLIVCIKNGKSFDVWPPARFLEVRSIARRGGKRRYMVIYEAPTGATAIRWTSLRAAVPRSLLAVQRPKPRTMPVVDDVDADALLRLWDAQGRFRPGRRT